MSPRTRRSLRLSGLRLLTAGVAALVLAACTPSGLSGTYEAKSPEGTMSVEFKSGGKMSMTMTEAGGRPETKEGEFLVDGNKVTLQISGGIPLTLTKNGKVLEAAMFGEVLRFEKK